MDIDQNITNDILDIIKTSRERKQFISILDLLANSNYEGLKDIDKAIDSYVPYGKKEGFLKLLKIHGNDIKSFHEFIFKLKEIILNIPEISITLSFEPTAETINTISGWLAINTKKPCLLDFHINPAIIGGIIVMNKGKYMDFSVKNKLEEKLKSNN